MTALPDADYVVLGSRIALELDGGFAVAVPTRMQLLQAAGVRSPLMLSVDAASADVHAAQRQALVDAGLLTDTAAFRNLFDELRRDPDWLHTAGEPGTRTPDIGYREIVDESGRVVVSLPVLVDDPLWHLTDAAVVVHAPAGDRVLRGFRGLYIAWLSAIAGERRAASGDEDRVCVVICESRQLGELLADWDDPRIRLVHTVHNSHLPAPYDDPDAPVTGLWDRWLGTLDGYDAVLWPTAAQRSDVAARFGHDDRFHVVPNSIALGDEPVASEVRDPRLVVMVNRLADQKRVDRAIRAWAAVTDAVPDARLEIYGDGPLRDELQRLIDELGLGAAVQLCGHTTRRDDLFDRAALFLSSTAFEGQGLSTAEALARGLPVVSFDVRYGPREAVGDAGVLVAPGDVDALADAVIEVLQDDDRRAAMSIAARDAARGFGSERVGDALAAALRAVVAAPRAGTRA